MLPSIKNEGKATPKVRSHREEKKQINIRWNSTLAFQFGLIVSMIAVLLVLESTWGLSSNSKVAARLEIDLTEPPLEHYVLEKDPVVAVDKPKVNRERQVLKPVQSNNFKQVTNDNPLVETPIVSSDDPVVTIPTPVEPSIPVVENKPININGVQKVPIYPGCESMSTNEERIKCMSSKIGDYIGRKFNTDRLSDKYEGSVQSIRVQFTIDSFGNVTDVKARAKGEDLEIEAKRVISMLPKMEPGKQYDRAVDVIYGIPIVFRVD